MMNNMNNNGRTSTNNFYFTQPMQPINHMNQMNQTSNIPITNFNGNNCVYNNIQQQQNYSTNNYYTQNPISNIYQQTQNHPNQHNQPNQNNSHPITNNNFIINKNNNNFNFNSQIPNGQIKNQNNLFHCNESDSKNLYNNNNILKNINMQHSNRESLLKSNINKFVNNESHISNNDIFNEKQKQSDILKTKLEDYEKVSMKHPHSLSDLKITISNEEPSNSSRPISNFQHHTENLFLNLSSLKELKEYKVKNDILDFESANISQEQDSEKDDKFNNLSLKFQDNHEKKISLQNTNKCNPGMANYFHFKLFDNHGEILPIVENKKPVLIEEKKVPLFNVDEEVKIVYDSLKWDDDEEKLPEECKKPKDNTQHGPQRRGKFLFLFLAAAKCGRNFKPY
jgi:hypothetical protein